VIGQIAVPTVILILAAGGAVALKTTRGALVEEPATPVLVRVVAAEKQEAFTIRQSFAGRAAPRRTTDLGFELPGHIIEVFVDEGARVMAGDVVARLDIDQLRAKRQQILAEREELQARLKLARITAERHRRLVQNGHTSKQSYDDARYEVEATKARLQGIEAKIRAVEIDLHDSVLRAPFDGVVVQRYFDEGSVIGTGQPVVRLNEAASLEARIGLPVHLRKRLRVGSRQSILINGDRVNGVVTAIVPDLNRGTRTVTVILSLNANDAVAGEPVRLLFEEQRRAEGFWVPTTALTEGVRGLWTVFVAMPLAHGTSAVREIGRKSVEIIHIETDRVFVRGTLEDSDLVVVSGVHRLVPGQLAKIQDRASASVAIATASGE
jgi:RND family efflux transporter MFP subunit